MKPHIIFMLTLASTYIALIFWGMLHQPVPTDANVIYEDDYFHLDYQIDCKPEGYVLIDNEGNRHWVEAGELEEYIINDNL